jgi:hypothetical protein
LLVIFFFFGTIKILKYKRSNNSTSLSNSKLFDSQHILDDGSSKMGLGHNDGFCTERTTGPVQDVLEGSNNDKTRQEGAVDALEEKREKT